VKPGPAANGAKPHANGANGANGKSGKALELEVQARRAEARWLHAHYGERLRELVAEVAALAARADAAEQRPAAPGGGGRVENRAEADGLIAALNGEVERLKGELERQKAANERYLARIYELKRAAQSGEAGGEA